MNNAQKQVFDMIVEFNENDEIASMSDHVVDATTHFGYEAEHDTKDMVEAMAIAYNNGEEHGLTIDEEMKFDVIISLAAHNNMGIEEAQRYVG